MQPEKSEVNEFLKDVKTNDTELDDKVFGDLKDKPVATEANPKPAEGNTQKDTSEDDEDRPKNRRFRRLEEKYKEEREANIAMAERIKVLSEFQNFAKENGVDPQEVTVFGTDEQGKIVKSYLDKRFDEVKREAKEEALREIEEAKRKAAEEEARESEFIDQEFEAIEDEFNVDLTSPKAKSLRNGFIDFISDISPKDENGEIVEYADMRKSFETFQKIISRDKPREITDRQKEIAARSMTNSGSPVNEAPQGPMNFKKATRFLDSLRGR